MPLCKRLDLATAQHGTGTVWAICPGQGSSGYHVEFHDWQFELFQLHADTALSEHGMVRVN
jgi:hypothetical protein